MQSLGPFNPVRFNESLEKYDSEGQIKADGSKVMCFEEGHEVGSESVGVFYQSNEAHAFGRSVQHFLLRREQLTGKGSLADVKTLNHDREDLGTSVKTIIQDRKVSVKPICLEDCRVLVREFTAENLDLIHQGETEMVEAILDCDEDAAAAALTTLKKGFEACFKKQFPDTWTDRFSAFLQEEINDIRAECEFYLQERGEALNDDHQEALDHMELLVGQELSVLAAAKAKPETTPKLSSAEKNTGKSPRTQTGSTQATAHSQDGWLTRAMKAFQKFLRSVFNLGAWKAEHFDMAKDHGLITEGFINAANGVEGSDQKTEFEHFNKMMGEVRAASEPGVITPEASRKTSAMDQASLFTEAESDRYQSAFNRLKRYGSTYEDLTQADLEKARDLNLIEDRLLKGVLGRGNVTQFLGEFAGVLRKAKLNAGKVNIPASMPMPEEDEDKEEGVINSLPISQQGMAGESPVQFNRELLTTIRQVPAPAKLESSRMFELPEELSHYPVPEEEDLAAKYPRPGIMVVDGLELECDQALADIDIITRQAAREKWSEHKLKRELDALQEEHGNNKIGSADKQRVIEAVRETPTYDPVKVIPEELKELGKMAGMVDEIRLQRDVASDLNADCQGTVNAVEFRFRGLGNHKILGTNDQLDVAMLPVAVDVEGNNKIGFMNIMGVASKETTAAFFEACRTDYIEGTHLTGKRYIFCKAQNANGGAGHWANLVKLDSTGRYFVVDAQSKMMFPVLDENQQPTWMAQEYFKDKAISAWNQSPVTDKHFQVLLDTSDIMINLSRAATRAPQSQREKVGMQMQMNAFHLTEVRRQRSREECYRLASYLLHPSGKELLDELRGAEEALKKDPRVGGMIKDKWTLDETLGRIVQEYPAIKDIQGESQAVGAFESQLKTRLETVLKFAAGVREGYS